MKKFIILLLTTSILFGTTINHDKFIKAVENNNKQQIKKLVDLHRYKDGNYLYIYSTYTLIEKRKVNIKLFEYIEKKCNFNINDKVDYFADTILHSSIQYYYTDMNFIKYLINRKDVDKTIRNSFIRIFDYFNYNTILYKYRTNQLLKHSFLKYWNTSWNTPLQDAIIMLNALKKRKQKGDTSSYAYFYDMCMPKDKQTRTIDDDISDLENIVNLLKIK